VVVYRPDAQFHKQKRLVRPIARVKSVVNSEESTPAYEVKQGMLLLAVNGIHEGATYR
jgi:hypothetical protein